MDHSHSDVTARTSRQAAVLDPGTEDTPLPVQDSGNWHPERFNSQPSHAQLNAECDDLDESHLIRGYD